MDSQLSSSTQKGTRPASAKLQNSQQQQQESKVSIEISGEGIKKGYKLPEQYKVNAKPIIYKVPERRSPDRSQQQSQQDQGYQYEQQQDFNDYMSKKMLNGQVRQIYEDALKQKDGENKEEFKKQTSKPFSTCKGRFQSAKNASQTQSLQNPSSNYSNVSTELENEGSRQQNRTEGQDPQELNQFCQFTTYSYSGQNEKAQNQIKISDLAEKFIKPNKTIKQSNSSSKKNLNNNTTNLQTNQQQQQQKGSIKQQGQGISFNPKNWVVQENILDKNNKYNMQYIPEERKKQFEELSEYVKQVKKQQIMPQDFDRMVDEAYLTIKENQDDQDISHSKCFDYEEFKKEDNNEIKKLDIELARQENQDIQRKLEILNKMMEESADDLSQYSMDDLKSRAAFITDLTKSKKFKQINQDQQQIEEKLLQKDEEDNEQNQNDFIQVPTSLKKDKSKNQYFIELNKKLAFLNEIERLQDAQLCEKLPTEAQQRLDQIMLENDQELQRQKQRPNPFSINQQNLREIDDRLRIYKLDKNEFIDEQTGIFDNSVLPKDKLLKEEAENRIIKEKMSYINNQLMTIAQMERESQQKNEFQAEKLKVKALCQQLMEEVEYNKSEYQIQKEKDLEELKQLNESSFELLSKLQNSQEIQEVQKNLYQIKQTILYHLSQLKKGILQEQEQTIEQEDYEQEKLEYQQLYQQFKENHANIYNEYQGIQQEEEKLMNKIKKWEEDMQLLNKVLDQNQNNQTENKLIEKQSEDQEQIDNQEFQKIDPEIEKQKIEQLNNKFSEQAKLLYPDLFIQNEDENMNQNKENDNYQQDFVNNI